MREFGIVCLLSSQLGRAAKLLDEELAARAATARSARSRISSSTRGMRKWRRWPCVRRENSPPDCFPILLTLESLVARGLRGVDFIVSDDHSGLRAARRAVLGGATWQRCQFHLARNAIHHAPSAETAGRIGRQLKSIWTADDLARAETAFAELVASYRDSAPRLADWLEQNVPEGLAVFTLPEHHRKRLRTSNPIERSVQQELKRRPLKVRVFPGEDALLRLVSAILVEIVQGHGYETARCAGYAAILTPVAASGSRAFCSALI